MPGRSNPRLQDPTKLGTDTEITGAAQHSKYRWASRHKPFKYMLN
ncbi:hypothetical protein [uncultured Arthrobacter sp.]|nr:hypothetical protein [uncultured Arthrobacter sp.]